MRKPVLAYANNKGANQPALQRSLISAFVVCCLDSIISLDSLSAILWLSLVCVAEQARFSRDEAQVWVGCNNFHKISARWFLIRSVPWQNHFPEAMQMSLYGKLGLTHICLVDPSILIIWTSPFPTLGVSCVLFHFYSISKRYSC